MKKNKTLRSSGDLFWSVDTKLELFIPMNQKKCGGVRRVTPTTHKEHHEPQSNVEVGSSCGVMIFAATVTGNRDFFQIHGHHEEEPRYKSKPVNHYTFQEDNDPKHMSKSTKAEFSPAATSSDHLSLALGSRWELFK